MAKIDIYATQEEFGKALAETTQNMLNDAYGYNTTAHISKVLKTNGETTGVTFQFSENEASPTFYPEDAFTDYKAGVPMEKITEQLCEQVIHAHENRPEVPDFSPEEARRRIKLTLVNTERNSKLISNVPHFELNDLSAIPRFYISEEASFVVTKELGAKMRLTPSEILEIGQRNVEAQTFKIQPIDQVLREMFESNGMDGDTLDALFPEGVNGPQMIVMTSENNIQGSNSLLSKAALSEVHDKLGDFFVLPSSLHEVICVPDDGFMDAEELKKMVKEVNLTEVSPRDFLSDNVYLCDGQKLSMVNDITELSISELGISEAGPSIRNSGMKF